MGEKMSGGHKQLAEGRWKSLSFVEQMANVGSEIHRALNWKKKNNRDYCDRSFEQALELLALTAENLKSPSALKELMRLKEALKDFFYGTNEFSSSEILWRKYFDHFNMAARKTS